MMYVALLRGINVGGNNKVDMKQLKAALEAGGFEHVSTYINSGNIFFTDERGDSAQIASEIENTIQKHFGLNIKVLIRNYENIQKVVASIPDEWGNNTAMKCDVMFLWENYDNPEVLQHLTIKPELDDVRYVDGAIIWKVDRRNVTKSGMMKLVGTELYKHMTIRNCNTVRKILERMETMQTP